MAEKTAVKTKWSLDPGHSEIGFRVKHMMITSVSGTFGKYDASVETEGDDFSTASIEFTADVDTITTHNEDRDKHLKSDDFFAADKYPQIKFKSTRIEKKDDENFILHGDLTIRDVTLPIALDVEMGGIGKDPWGNTKAGFSLTGKIKRTDYKLNWNAALETGGVLVGEEVRISAEVQLVKQA